MTSTETNGHHRAEENGCGLSERHLKCIDSYMAGSSKRDALRAGGFSDGTTVGKVFDRPDVKAEIARRQAAAREEGKVTQDWVIENHVAAVNAPKILAKFLKTTSDGKLDWDFTGATQEEKTLIDSVTTETYMEGRGEKKKPVKRFKVRIPSRLAHLDSISRIMGFNKDSLEHRGEMSLVERLQQGRRRVKRTPEEILFPDERTNGEDRGAEAPVVEEE